MFSYHKQAQAPLHNLDSEQSLLGALLLNNQTFEHVEDFLKPQHFSHPVHGLIFEFVSKLIGKLQVADPITLKPMLENEPLMQEAGGIGYLVDLAGGVCSTVSVRDYGQMIYELYLRRSLATISDSTIRAAHNTGSKESIQEIIQKHEEAIYLLSQHHSTKNEAINISIAMERDLKTIEKYYQSDNPVTGIPSGFKDLDKWLCGFHPETLTIIGARPGIGKTSLGMNIAYNAGKAGINVLVFSLEMSANQLGRRLVGQLAGIDGKKIRSGKLTPHEFQMLNDAYRSHDQSGIKILIDDASGVPISTLHSRARRYQRQHDIGLIVVDYLQLLDGTGKNQNNRVHEITEISKGLKEMAKNLKIPVIAPSQLSRSLETRENKRPNLSDLRDSGSIEQDADVVIFIHREEEHLRNQEPPINTDKHVQWQQDMSKAEGKAELIISKNRHGDTGKIKLEFDKKTTQFKDSSTQSNS